MAVTRDYGSGFGKNSNASLGLGSRGSDPYSGYSRDSTRGGGGYGSVSTIDDDTGQSKLADGFMIEDTGALVSIIGIKEVIMNLAKIDWNLTQVIIKGVPHLGELMRDAIKRNIGKRLPGMPELEDITKELHKAAGRGNGGDTPLLYTGDLHDSIEVLQMDKDARGEMQYISLGVVAKGIGGERLYNNMYGYSIQTRKGYSINIPARDPVTPTIHQYKPYLYREFNRMVRNALDNAAAGVAHETWKNTFAVVERPEVDGLRTGKIKNVIQKGIKSMGKSLMKKRKGK